MLSKDALKGWMTEKKTIWQIVELTSLSRNTIEKYVKLYELEKYPGFYSRNRKLGRRKGFRHTEDWKQAHRERMLGENNPFHGKQHTEETKKQMSQNHADFTGDLNPFKQSLNDPKKWIEHVDRCTEIWFARNDEYRRKFGEKRRKGFGDITGYFWSRLEANAETRSIPVLLTIQDAWQLFLNQEGKCALSGIQLILGNGEKKERTASLDRIRSDMPYELGNVQWIHKHLNIMKWSLDNEQFIGWCKIVYESSRRT